jgi:MoxR-like ATPase
VETNGPATIDELTDGLAERAYLADRGLATVLHVALALGKPLLLEGEAGVGKTEVAKTLAEVLGARLIRVQCYEGIDVAHALYDWSYARQMLYIRTLEVAGGDAGELGRRALHDLFGPEFLVRRPLLEAIEHDDPVPPVLLVDEIDRADDEFEAFLLELLSDFQVTIPEIGTLRAERRPVVILTSNRTRELHDALKRRCLYHWIGHPSLEREIAIVRVRVPGVPERLAAAAAAFVARLRTLDLTKSPGVAETIDWTTALAALGEVELEAGLVDATLGAVLKYHEDLERVRDRGLAELVALANAEAREAS